MVSIRAKNWSANNWSHFRSKCERIVQIRTLWWTDMTDRCDRRTWRTDVTYRHDGLTWRKDMTNRHDGLMWWTDVTDGPNRRTDLMDGRTWRDGCDRRTCRTDVTVWHDGRMWQTEVTDEQMDMTDRPDGWLWQKDVMERGQCGNEFELSRLSNNQDDFPKKKSLDIFWKSTFCVHFYLFKKC